MMWNDSVINLEIFFACNFITGFNYSRLATTGDQWNGYVWLILEIRRKTSTIDGGLETSRQSECR